MPDQNPGAPTKSLRAPRRSRLILPGKALVALIAGVLAVVAITAMSYQSLQSRAEAVDAVNHTLQAEQALYRVISAATDAETGQRGFLLTGVERYLDPYNQARASLASALGGLRRLTSDNANQQQRLDLIEPLVAQKLDELGATIERQREGDGAAALALVRSDRGQVLMAQIRDLIGEMLDEEERLLGQRSDARIDANRWSTYVVFGGSALILCMLGLIGWLWSRDFRALDGEAWLQRAQATLSGQVQGDLRLEPLGDKILRVLAENLDARVGAIYVTEPGGRLRRIAGHALERSGDGDDGAMRRVGDGLLGQAAKEDRLLHVHAVPADYLRVTSATGGTTPRELVIAPASSDGAVHAVVELGFFHAVDAVELTLLERVAETIAVAIRSSRDRSRLEELLEETQRQGEELQAQQEELRVSNEELEEQARALQLSQTNLENQQSELEQINTQLEEQAQSLEHQRDELTRAGVELQRSNEYKSQFLANMSHELRTPLNSTLILAKLLADNREANLNDEQIKFAQTIYSAGNDLLTLINDILDLSKIDAGMLDVRPERVTVARLVDELTSTFQPIATQRHLELAVTVEPGAPETIETDPARLQQILRNLLSNALKFTDQGGVSLTISGGGGGGSGDDRAAIRFAVRDTGPGIALAQQELIFEPFRQGDGASNRKYGGTGLGLSISRDLARLLGGALRVESAPGRGSTFTLSLPAETPVRAVDAAPSGFRTHRSSSPPEPAASMAPTPAPAPRRSSTLAAEPLSAPPFPDDRDQLGPTSRTLLIVEDDLAFAHVLYDLAHELDFQALVATTAEAGLALARQLQPNAIVLDVGLPDRSGLAVLDTLKRDPRTRHLPVHVVSATDHTRAALELGAAGYALKPIAREQLVVAIKRLEAKFTQKVRRVLIVEDDVVLRESTARLVAGDDVVTVTAGTVAEALAHLQSTTFDCMVLDLALPDRSGLELLDEMSHGEQYGFPPVIVYTGRSLSHDEVHELERFSRSIIIKGARSPERLLDQVTLFLHQVEAALPPERQRMLRSARDREAVFEGRRILVVEDDVRNVFALTSVLEPKGAIVDIARNGREAIAHLHQRPDTDLVLMDIMMPEMDGIQATRELRKDPRFARLPIIALTAKAMADDREKCLEAGANDYIAKPLDVDKLLSLARVWIRK